MNRPKDFPEVITLCGSTRFRDNFLETYEKLSLQGKIVLSVTKFTHADNLTISEDQKKKLDELHLRKIDLSDSIYVIDVNGYIGESTKREIEYAKNNSKQITYYSQEMKK